MAHARLYPLGEGTPAPTCAIAFCLFKYFPWGGLQRDFLEIARRCRDLGHRVRVYVQTWEGVVPDGFDVVEVPVHAFTNHGRCRRFAEWVAGDLASHPVDLVVGFNKMPGLDVYYAADSCFVEKAHSQRPLVYRLLPRYRVLSDLEHAVFGQESSALIMMIAPQQKRFFQRYHATPDSRIVALPPGLAPDRVRALREARRSDDLRRELGVGPDGRLLLFVGSGFVKKGLDRVLRGFAALPRAQRDRTHLAVLGKDEAAPFARLARHLRVADRVHFLGGRDDVPEFMASADGLVLPALDENAGMVILEALFAGLPLLVTDVCGFADHVREADAGIVLPSPYAQPAFDAALETLLASPRREVWRGNARAYTHTRNLQNLHARATEVVVDLATRRRSRATGPVLAFCLYKYFPWGGLQRDMLRIARECARRGYRIRIYSMDWQGDCPEGFERVKVPVRGFSNHRRNENFHTWVQAHLRERPVDLVVGFNKMPGLDVYFAADGCYQHKARKMRGFLYRSTGRYRTLAAHERAVFGAGGRAHALLLTGTQKEQFQRWYGTEEHRLHILPPGVSRERIRPGDAETIRRRKRAELGLDDDDRLLLLVGSGFVTKGLDRALRALAHLPQALRDRTRLCVIGQDKADGFRRRAERLRIADRVEFLGGRDDVRDFMLAADVLVHPAYAESAGIVLLEAVIAGLPVLVTEVCGYAEHVAASGCGHVLREPFSQRELDEQLARMLQAPEREEWSRRGVAYGRTRALFDLPEAAADRIEARLRAVAGTRSAS
jgi:UDP-glucose:(heptosyl)LPS alpha-1,3-glucosyltransferase